MPEVLVGKPAPDFSLDCTCAPELTSRHVGLGDFRGRWLVLVFYPRDFSFVCPTELTAFSAHLPEFQARECDLLGISVDSIALHQEWLTTPADQGGLGALRFPLASDPRGEAARAYGVWVEEKAVSTRGLFVIDPEGILQYLVVHNLNVGRRPDVVLRVIDALQTGGLCPANWISADGTIDPERALQPGRILGHYRIRKRLGGGTFGTVFSAWDLRLERTVALKVLKRDVISSRDAALAEARAAARLNHPNVSTIYAVDEEDGLPVIAMEYVDGQPLTEVIREGIAARGVLPLAMQIASGIGGAHGQGIVHGDLKPGNVMVTRDNVAKILDFGLARSQRPTLADVDAVRSLPAAETPDKRTNNQVDHVEATVDYSEEAGQIEDAGIAIRGTPAYMSPEQASGMPATNASDVFSFGLLLYELLTGRSAQPDVPIVALLLRLRTWEPDGELIDQANEAYRPLLRGLLNREPGARPTMADVARQLAAIVTSGDD